MTQPSAEIVQLPARRDPAEGRASLVQALQSLQQALEAQNAAVRRWRSCLAELRDRMQQLGSTMSAYQAALATIPARPESQVRH